jgi:F-box protein 11
VRVVAADGSGEFTTIAAALQRSWRGTRILLRPGVYRESLTIEQPLEIIGDGPPDAVRIESDNGPCLNLRCAGAVIRGLTLCAGPGSRPAALQIDEGRALIEDCTISAAGRCAVRLGFATALPTFRRCHIRGTGKVGVLVQERSLATLEDCTIAGHSAAGVEVITGGRARLCGCQLLDNAAQGVLVRRDGAATLEDCLIARSGKTGVAGDQAHIRLVRCQIREGRASGIHMSRSLAVLEDCTIQDNAKSGLKIRRRARVLARRCRVQGNNAAVVMSRSGLLALQGGNLTGNATGWDIEPGGAIVLLDGRQEEKE